MDEGQRNHLINQYLSRIADLWIPTDSLEEKVSFVNFLATAINSWRPINAEYFREPTRATPVPARNGAAGPIRLLRQNHVGSAKKASRRRGYAAAAERESD